ncbi:MAG: dihydrofolate reductase family protein [Chloroflexota bacterium]
MSGYNPRHMRPFVTLTYAQSLDGSIGLPGQRLELSGPESARMTHELRTQHDGILVGIGTVLVDDPRLTVRHAIGRNPQPIVLDSKLRIPLTAALVKHPDRLPWLAATDPDPERQSALEALGARVYRLPSDTSGRVGLVALLDLLGGLGLKTLMVEGGARVITAFLTQRLANRLVLTVSPRLIGGVRAVDTLGESGVELKNVHYRQLGSDMIVEADLDTRSAS